MPPEFKIWHGEKKMFDGEGVKANMTGHLLCRFVVNDARRGY
jgi:hypothetical protein